MAKVTLFDDDVVHNHLSKVLGINRVGIDIILRRIDLIASEIFRNGVIIVCAVAIPYRRTQNELHSMVGNNRLVKLFLDSTT